MPAAGYSGTPLAKKLGFKDGHTVAVLDGPDDLRDLLDPLPDGIELRTDLRAKPDVVVAFFTRRASLEKRLDAMGRAIFPASGLWICWPKKSSKVPTDITEDTIREVALPKGLVDTKVCAVSDIWSGLRVVWRKERR